MEDVRVPQLLQQGTLMTKVSALKYKKCIFRLDPDAGQIIWESKKHRIVPLETIKEIRSGSDATNCRKLFRFGQECEDRWLTVIYIFDGNYKTLHLVAPTTEVFHMWDDTLRKLYAIRRTLMSGLGNFEMREAIWEKQYWKRAEDDGPQNKLDFEEVKRMCRRLHVHSSTENLLRLFKEADTRNQNFLDFNDFRHFVKMLKRRPEIDRLYHQLCSANGKFDFPAFERFMRELQKSTLTQDELCCIFSKYASVPSPTRCTTSIPWSDSVLPPRRAHTLPKTPSPSLLLQPDHPCSSVLTIDGFTSYLLSSENSAFEHRNERVFHDMTRPLSEYYISSSHNTYLVGHQLVGVSTVEGYIRALLHGCRSVELDIYDGEIEPVVYHGKTLTSKLLVREICLAIAKYAFVTSPYPVIISAEIHCGQAQQDMVVAIMTEVFGEALVTAPIEGRPRINQLPSPEDLKGRVLLKAKCLYTSEHDATRDPELVIDTESSTTETSDTDALHEMELEWQKVRQQEVEVVKTRNIIQRVRRRSRLSSPSPSSKTMQAKHIKVKISLKLASLLVYTVGVKCRGINKKEAYAPEHVFSLSETTANKILKHGMIDFIKHNRTHLVRIYPKGLRLNSSNYELHRYWSAGAQLVSINWQTFDLGHIINHAMFQRNGRSGYVLKPLALRTPDKELLSKRTSYCLEVTIISAQQLPWPKDANGREIVDKLIVDPFVEVTVHIPDWYRSPHHSVAPPNVPSTSSTPARTVLSRTGSVRNNGFNPVWEEHLSIPFDCVGDMVDLIFVKFAVKQEDKTDGEPLAIYCTSLGSMEQGYRHLPLHDSHLSQYLFSTLFVRVSIRET